MNETENTARVGLISGGSSGIGLACARALLHRGYRVVLLARSIDRLEAAKAELGHAFSQRIELICADVRNEADCSAAVDTVIRRFGRLDWLITSAGIVEPELFLDSECASHRGQMETNYFGTLHLARPAARQMRIAGAGRMTMIASAAGFVGIIGYSSYAPSKFAVRALAEILRMELEPHGIAVSVACPPDTQTPQLERELRSRPSITSRIAADGGVLSAETVAESLIAQAEAGRFVLIPTRSLSLLAAFHSLIAPLLFRRQRRLYAQLRDQETDSAAIAAAERVRTLSDDG